MKSCSLVPLSSAYARDISHLWWNWIITSWNSVIHTADKTQCVTLMQATNNRSSISLVPVSLSKTSCDDKTMQSLGLAVFHSDNGRQGAISKKLVNDYWRQRKGPWAISHWYDNHVGQKGSLSIQALLTDPSNPHGPQIVTKLRWRPKVQKSNYRSKKQTEKQVCYMEVLNSVLKLQQNAFIWCMLLKRQLITKTHFVV